MKRRLPRIMAASAVMAGALWAANRWLVPELPLADLGAELPNIGGLMALVTLGGGVFVAAAFALGATSVADIKGMIRPRRATPPEA